MIVENALKTYSTTLEKIFPTLLQKRSKVSYIGLAIFLLVVQQTYSFLNAPRQLRRFPKISFFAVVKSFLTNESVFNRTKRLVTPLMNAGHKFYVSRVPLTWSIYIIDPVATRTLLLKTENLPKSHRFFDTLGADSPIVQFMGSDNVAISNGVTWKRQRKIMNPAFHRSMPVKTFGSVVPHLFAAIEKEPDAFPITVRMKNFTLDVLGLAAFGFDFQSLKGDPEGWTKTYNVVVSSLFNPWLNIFAKLDFLLKYISPERRRVMRATTKFNGMLDDLTNKKRQEILQKANSNIPENEKDLLTLMIEADMRDNNGDTSNEELRHNIALFFLAGHETTAHTLIFCFYNLAKNKHVQRKAREEVLRILGDEPVDVIPTLEEMKQMDYINMVIKENLRRCGPVDKLFTRRTVEDIDLAGTIIPKGSDISVDIAALHMDPKSWQNPEQFIPERFEEGGEFYKQSGGLTWAPFSNGSRQCLGMNFSLTEQRLVLSMLLKKYEIDVPKDSIHYDEIIFDKPMNFAPNSLKLKFTKRY